MATIYAQSLDHGVAGGKQIDAVIATCDGRTEIDTAIGCIPFNDTVTLAANAAKFAIGISGTITLFLIAIASYRVITSSGNPKALQAARESLFSAIGGLLMIIFSGFVLQLIGVDVLGLFAIL